MAENKSPEELKKQIEQMREWIDCQPHFPKDVDEFLIKQFLHSCYYDIEKAKSAAELFFKIRSSSPDLLNNRDPLTPPMQKCIKILNLAQLKISGNRNLFMWQLNDPGLENYDYTHDAKMFLLSTDAWLLDSNGLEESDIVIMDVKDITLKFITKFNVSVARKISKYQEDAMPIRLKHIHVVNAPPFIDKLHALMKPFLKKEINDMIHFHTPKSETIYQYLDKEDLPEEYGGTNGKMEDHMKDVLEVIMRHRERLTGNLWRSADKKSKNKTEFETDVTSFRSLAID